MERIETPEEFAKRHYDAIATMSVNGVLYLRDLTKARDAEIRADERQKAAENWEAFARKIWGSNRVMKVEQFVSEGKAALMAEPEEAQG